MIDETANLCYNTSHTRSYVKEDSYEDYEELETRELSFSCNCSRERCYRVLGTLPKEDLLAMIEEDHGCDMHCEYCSSTYHFEEKELREIYDYLVIKEKTHA